MADVMTVDRALIDVAHDVVNSASGGTVFGTPITQDGTTVVPVARVTVWGASDGGSQNTGIGIATGIGGPNSGVHATARPVGALVITHGKVTWQPTVDPNKIVLGGQVVGVVALLALRAVALVLDRRRDHGSAAGRRFGRRTGGARTGPFGRGCGRR